VVQALSSDHFIISQLSADGVIPEAKEVDILVVVFVSLVVTFSLASFPSFGIICERYLLSLESHEWRRVGYLRLFGACLEHQDWEVKSKNIIRRSPPFF